MMQHGTVFKVHKTHYLTSCPSTHLYIKNNIANFDPRENLAVFTYNQQTGIGQNGRTWYTGCEENLALSLLVFPQNTPIESLPDINRLFAIALRSTIQNIVGEAQTVQIKWPNDIYVNDQKIGGILINSSLAGSEIKHLILSCGININSIKFPIEITNASSLKLITGNYYSLREITDSVLNSIVEAFVRAPTKTLDIYNSYLWSRGCLRAYLLKSGERIMAEIQSTNQDGQLIVKGETGIMVFNNGEIHPEL